MFVGQGFVWLCAKMELCIPGEKASPTGLDMGRMRIAGKLKCLEQAEISVTKRKILIYFANNRYLFQISKKCRVFTGQANQRSSA